MLSPFVKLSLSNRSVNRFLRGRQLLLICLIVVLCCNVVESYTAMAAPLVYPTAQDSPLSPLEVPAQVEAAEVAPVVVVTPLLVPLDTMVATQTEVISPAVSASSDAINATVTAAVDSGPVKGSQTSLTLVGLVLVGVLFVVGVVASRQR